MTLLKSSGDGFALIVLAGVLPPPAVFQKFAAGASRIIAADGAARPALDQNLKLSLVIGDLDSIDEATLEECRKRNVSILREAEQETNDFEKALRQLAREYNGAVRIVGLTGARLDQTLTNLSVMLAYSDQFESLTGEDGVSEFFFLTPARPTCSIETATGILFSLIPYGEALGIVTKNLEFALADDTLKLGARVGISNVATGSPVTIAITSGALLVAVHDLD